MTKARAIFEVREIIFSFFLNLDSEIFLIPGILSNDMATLLPPPKRQKIYHGDQKIEPEVPTPTSHVIVQFLSEEDGSPLAPPVNIPANVSREGLEALVNKLGKQVSLI